MKDMSYKKQVILMGMTHRRACIRGGHVLEEGMSYRRIYLIGGHIVE